MSAKKQLPEVSDDIKSYLDEIAERLWSGHAAVMVGAGFSKNSSPAFPDWNKLGDLFYEKIYGCLPDGKKCYLNVLKLADEVQAAFGRPTLDHLIRSAIPDDNSNPSSLHKDLLELPWTDVFTTNYDTLLERARRDVLSKKFDVVVNKEDLVYSEKPRIIKLHGSLPSKRPFIITEEDYRKYPEEFAPFVNTVRQALLENTLCLIGFSGDDPNFLQWIGWIRDNLGDRNAPKIYLIGIFDGPDAKKKLLEQCNIIPIDFCHSVGVGRNHRKALDVFFKYLRNSKQDFNRLEWPITQSNTQYNSQIDSASQIKNIVTEWEEQRLTFPNWVVVPKDRRSSLWFDTNHWVNNFLLSKAKELETPLDIEFLYELNWRLERCLQPILNDLIDNYEKIISKYNPFPDILKLETAEIRRDDVVYKKLEWDKIQIKWLELHISLIRYYREEGILDKWMIIDERLRELSRVLSPEIIAQWHYERCMQALFTSNITRLQSILKDWPTDDNFPFWEAKRAGLIAELGNIDIAEKTLENSLNSIRAQLNLSPASSDYSLISQESYVMWLLLYVKNVSLKEEQIPEKLFDQENNKKEQKNNFDFDYETNGYIIRDEQIQGKSFNNKINMRQRIRQQFNKRWSWLVQYKCDPWKEFELFETYLKHDPSYKPVINKEHGFDIGQVTINYNFGGEDEEVLTAYSFLRFFEEVGMPYRIPRGIFGHEAAKGALNRISKLSPFWALAILLRMGDSNLIDSIFDRESINKMQRDQIDRLIHEYLHILEKAKPEIEAGDWLINQNYGFNLAKIIPDILSRLCCKCSEDAKEQILNFLKEVFTSKHKKKYIGISNLIKRLMVSWPKSSQYRRLPELLEIPVLTFLSPLEEREFPDPFYFISWTNRDIARFKTVSIKEEVITALIQKVNSNDPEERKRSIARLVCLYEYGLLNLDQETRFADLLWKQIDDVSGFPTDTIYYSFVFLSLPHPSGINPNELMKTYIKNSYFPIQKGKGEKGISITQSNIPLCHEIIGATQKPFFEKGIIWSEKEVIELFYRLLQWWDADKEYLKNDEPRTFGNINDEFKQRFAYIVNILTHVIFPKLTPQSDDSTKEQLSRLLNELSDYGIPSISSAAAGISVFSNKLDNVCNSIGKALISTNNERIIDAYKGIFQILTLYKSGKIAEIPDYIWRFITIPIKWRHMPTLIYAIGIMNDIFKRMADLIPQQINDDLLIGLSYLLDETNLDNQSSPVQKSDRLDCRVKAAELAFNLYKYYKTGNLLVPKPILDWENTCTSAGEFAEVFNQWAEV